jgi:hypothetical protein
MLSALQKPFTTLRGRPCSHTCRVCHTPARGTNVWARLISDTAARKALPTRNTTFTEGSTAQSSTSLGWGQNLPLTAVKQAPDGTEMLDAPLAALHHLTRERYRRGHPVEFFRAIRPQCRTTSQTMRCVQAPGRALTCLAARVLSRCCIVNLSAAARLPAKGSSSMR